MNSPPELTYDRVVDPALSAALGPDGPLAVLLELRNVHSDELDLQLRRNGRQSSASLYFGLVRAVTVTHGSKGWRVSTHPTLAAATGFESDPGTTWLATHELSAWADAIRDHVTKLRTLEPMRTRWLNSEGHVHAALCAGHGRFAVIDREAVIGFPNRERRTEICDELRSQIQARIATAGRLGTECDVIAVDDTGRLLVIEAKPANAAGAKHSVVAQVAMYALLFQRLVQQDFDSARLTMRAMLDQRVALGLSPDGFELVESMPIVPVVVIETKGATDHLTSRLQADAYALTDLFDQLGIEPLEVHALDKHGTSVTIWKPTKDPMPDTFTASVDPALGATGFVAEARRHAAIWKATVVPAEARGDGAYAGGGVTYPFCLPAEHAALNLLPDARAKAIERFAAAGIPWHRGVEGGPTNHLLSSQIHCANSLAPFVEDPGALVKVFAPVLPIAEVLPFGIPADSPFDLCDHVVFEWAGGPNYLNEHLGAVGKRGANNTSADAAIRYRALDGTTEIALIEWKYTEHYGNQSLLAGKSGEVRRKRYESLFHHATGPIDPTRIHFEHCFVEPMYQLMRLQLLAWQMERDATIGVDRVRFVVVAPAANTQLHRSPAASLASSGMMSDVYELWSGVLRETSNFAVLDSAHLVASDSPLGDDYRARYGHLASPPSTEN